MEFMAIADRPSVVTLPRAVRPGTSIVDFLSEAFPNVSRAVWTARMRAGKVLDDAGAPVAPDAAYMPGRRIFYFREVENEPAIPFAEEILFQNGELLVACKPHFLPVTPGGRFVNECLLQRLRRRTGIEQLAPLHRIDRETAGIVVFSVNPETRGRYHDLFMRGAVEKTYFALAELREPPREDRWIVENRIVRGEPRFRMTTTPGAPNARSRIHFEGMEGTCGRFRLQPETGKTHQLRLHMSGLKFGILNDRVYPELQPQRDDDFAHPLQLLAAGLRFHDPVAGVAREFVSTRVLQR
jgi:tRNA pseudouridine32 synthase/23S rRNA pseudouridine746 synthase